MPSSALEVVLYVIGGINLTMLLGMIGLGVRIGRYLQKIDFIDRNYSEIHQKMEKTEHLVAKVASEMSHAVQRIEDVESEMRHLDSRWRARFEIK